MPDSALPIPQGEDLFSQVEAEVRELQPVNGLHEMALTIQLALRRLVFPLRVVDRARLQGELWNLVDGTRSRVEVGFPTLGEKKQTDPLTQRLRTLLDRTTNALEMPDGRRAFENLLCEWRKVAKDIEGGLCTKPEASRVDAQPEPVVSDDSHLGSAKLAELFNVPAQALRKRLDRWRWVNHAGWREVSDPAPREARYLYRVGSVRPIIQELRASSETSSERPAKKK